MMVAAASAAPGRARTPVSAAGTALPSADDMHGAGLQRREALGRDGALGPRELEVLERRVDALVAEAERAPVMAERPGRAAQPQRLDGLGRVHVVVAHEPVRLVG